MDICPECGKQAVPLPHCPDCRIRIVPWTHEDCSGCGRLLDFTAANDDPPPFGVLDESCSECGEDLSATSHLECAACGVTRLLRLDFAKPERAKAERILEEHGLVVARGDTYLSIAMAGPRRALFIRSCCWPSAAWVMEWAGIVPLDASLHERGRCLHCGYELYGITSSHCPECGRHASTVPSQGGFNLG